jgi:hypothetical protein
LKADRAFLPFLYVNSGAEKALYGEFALVLNIQPEQVLPFITERLAVDEKRRKEL